MSISEAKKDRIEGLLLGTAVGDAVGLPREGVSARRSMRLFGDGPIEHGFVLGRGMCSDDTEHTCMIAQAWLASSGDVDRFVSSFAWRLRWWLLGLPAGIGMATLKSIVKLWLGISPKRSGVWSAGNGPAMRAAILGVVAKDDRTLDELVQASSRLTHTDPRAEEGARAVALAARLGYEKGTELDPIGAIDEIIMNVNGDELATHLRSARQHLTGNKTPTEFAAALGCEKAVSGYVNRTVPAALFCWLRYLSDFRAAVEAIIRLGGDTDSTAAITGALAGVTLGESAIPRDWINGIIEWPRSTDWIRLLARRVADVIDSKNGGDAKRASNQTGPLSLFWPGLLLRNLMFLTIVLLHALRRLLPPY